MTDAFYSVPSISLKLSFGKLFSINSKVMCLNPHTIYTNSRYISKIHARQFLIDVPCGICSECLKSKRSEWRLRAYYEALRCFRSGGYVLFDTLTYREDDIPFIHDHYGAAILTKYDGYCFNRKHLQVFFKNLRSKLISRGFDVSDKFRYFLATEYGTDPDKTQRSHIHFLCFVNCGVDPLVLSRLISDTWKYGRTDGVAFHGSNYVLSQRVFVGNDEHLSQVVNYVTKYVTKDIVYDKDIRKRVSGIMDWRYGKGNWQLDIERMMEYRKLLRQTQSFHLESKGFGLYALECNSVEDIIRNNSIPMLVSKKRVSVSIPLPMYFSRKIFKKVVWFNGLRFWVDNENGVRYRSELFKRRKVNVSNRFVSFFSSLKNYPEINADKVFLCFDRAVSSGYNKFLDYYLFKFGRIRTDLDRLYNDEELAYQSVLPEATNFQQLYNEGNLLFVANTAQDAEFYGKRFVSFNPIPYYKYFPRLSSIRRRVVLNAISSAAFSEFYLYNSNFDKRFKDYDEFIDVFRYVSRYIGLCESKSFEEIELVKKKFKEYQILK